MSSKEEQSTHTIMSVSNIAQSRRITKRIKQISGNTRINAIALQDYSNGWPDQPLETLLADCKKVRKSIPHDAAFCLTDASMLKDYLWKRVPRSQDFTSMPSKRYIAQLREPDLGIAAVTNIPVIDLGAPCQASFIDPLRELGITIDIVEMEGVPSGHIRVAGFGLTYGTELRKIVSKHWDGPGRFMGPRKEIKVIVANNVLDLYVGKYSNHTRATDRIPPGWQAEQDKKVDTFVKEIQGKLSKQGELPKPKSKPRKPKVEDVDVEGQDADDQAVYEAHKHIINDVLREACSKSGIATSGNKLDLILRLNAQGSLPKLD